MTGKDFSEIEKAVSEGNPVLAWFTISHEMPNKRTWKTPAGKTISAPTPLHCIVVTGVDADYVYFNDSEAVKKMLKCQKRSSLRSTMPWASVHWRLNSHKTPAENFRRCFFYKIYVSGLSKDYFCGLWRAIVLFCIV